MDIKTRNPMRLRGTAIDVSRLCLGTMTFGSQIDPGEARSMVDMSIERGIHFFDTANSYNAGKSEEILGAALKDRRDRVVLASKVFNKMGDGSDDRGLSRSAILKAVEGSLRRLQTDYLDIYYLHAPDYEIPLEETLGAMDQLVRSGKVRCIGASNYASWQLCQMHWIAHAHGWSGIPVSKPMYNLLARGIEQEFLPACAALDVSTIVYNPLAGGLLTGKHQPQQPIPGTRFENNPQYTTRYWHAATFAAVAELSQIARSADRTLTSVALNWLLHHTTTDCVILGASRLEHLAQNIQVCDEGPLPEAVVEACDQVWKKLRGASPTYNR